MANPRAIIDAQSACFYVRNCDTEQHQPPPSPIRVSSRQAGHRYSRKASNLQYQLSLVERLNLTGKILLLLGLCSSLILLSFCSGSIHAKVHHSRRQTQQQPLQTPTNQPSSGRASTNWWNVWWQQYINEADKPTVRPIVAVSFNGRSINLSRQEQDQQQQQQLDMTDELSQSSADSDRYDQQPASRQPNRKQPMQQPSSNQMGWQQASRPMERNMISQSGAYDGLPMGIQMRAQMSRNRQAMPSTAAVPAEEQQVFAMDAGQEEQIQQHYQMLDYSDENDPQLVPQDGKQTNESDSEQEQANDSSSQNMMAGENRKPTTLPTRTSDSPTITTTISDKRPGVTLSSSTLPVAVTTTTAAAAASTTTTIVTTTPKPLKEATVTSTQASTFTETPPPTTPPTKTSSSRVPPTILETNRVIQTTTKSPTETSTKMQGIEESSTTDSSSNKQTTTQTPIVQTTIASLPSTVTDKPNQTSNTVVMSGTTNVSGSNQKLATTTTTTEIPSTTTDAERGTTVTVMENGMQSDSNKQTATSTSSPTASVTVAPDAVIKESEETSDDDDAGEEDDDEDDSTTTLAPIVKPTTSRTTTTTQSPESSGPSTQLPVIDLARLPKTTTTTTTQSSTQITSTEAPITSTVNSRGPTTGMMNANIDLDLMKTVVEEDSAITLPMETFMRMMNQVAAMNEAATGGSSSTPGNVQVMSTTLTIPSTTTTTTTTTGEDQTPDTTTPGTQSTGTTLPTLSAQTTTESKPELSVDTLTPTTPKRKLQPPPTTTEMSATTTSEPTTITTQQATSTSNKSNINEMVSSQDKATTTGMDDTSSTMGTQRTVMLNIAPGDGGSKAGATDSRVELVDLDLMPIQRMMNQQQTSTSTGPASLPTTLTTTTTTTGEIQPETKQETMVVDVEPGMRLRPPTTLPSMTSAATSKNPQPIYMIMLSQQMADELNNSTTANTQKFSTTTGLLTMNPLRSTTPAPIQTTSTPAPAPEPTTTTASVITTTTTTPKVATTTVVSTTRSQPAETKTPTRGQTSPVVTESTPVITSTTTVGPTTRATTSAPSSSANLTLNSATTISGLVNTFDKPQVVNRGKTINRIFGKQPNGTFVSTRLRSNLGTKQLSSSKINQASARLQANGPSQMVQSMAIRQFGGANRMSVLENQPVAFGRPTMMTSSAGQPRFQAPVFEYGASIVVKRPDEPLANGQMPNCTLTGKNFCVLTKDYPMNEVRQAVERSFRSVRIMYEELQTVSDQELHKDDFNATNNQAASGKFACQTQVEMMRPGWAKDELTKEWMLVVNTDVFPQRVRTESCAQPNTPCEFIAPFYDSTCQQRYSLHRMIAIDPHDPSRSPQVAIFKFPAGCVCRVHPIRKTPS